jgi:hypothetical protein
VEGAISLRRIRSSPFLTRRICRTISESGIRLKDSKLQL